jgi:hypothetical protein
MNFKKASKVRKTAKNIFGRCIGVHLFTFVLFVTTDGLTHVSELLNGYGKLSPELKCLEHEVGPSPLILRLRMSAALLLFLLPFLWCLGTGKTFLLIIQC